MSIQTDRLLRLADFLDTVPGANFDFGCWVSQWAGGEVFAPIKCGTTACAFGWATAIPEFQALGLRLARSSYGDWGLCADSTPEEERGNSWDMTCRAANTVFGLSQAETEFLFTPSDCDPAEDFESEEDDFGSDGKPYEQAPPTAVAEHIRRCVGRVLAGRAMDDV